MDELTNDEFDLLDELYFVQHFTEIIENLGWNEQKIIDALSTLIEKELVKALSDHDTEFHFKASKNGNNDIWKKLYFLATKKGLMLHNGF